VLLSAFVSLPECYRDTFSAAPGTEVQECDATNVEYSEEAWFI